MKIKTSSIIWINFGGQEFQLSKEEALVLFEQLKKELGIKDKEGVRPHDIWPSIPPYAPQNPSPEPYIPIIPTWPIHPKPYEIWCGQPTSTSNS